MKMMKKAGMTVVLILVLVISVVGFAGCNGQKEEFKQWNDCASLKALKEYVAAVTDKNSKDFIPQEDRIAVFDTAVKFAPRCK